MVMQDYTEKSISHDENEKFLCDDNNSYLEFFFWASEHQVVSGVQWLRGVLGHLLYLSRLIVSFPRLIVSLPL